MTRSLYLIGEPGVGKTTLMAELSRKYEVGEAQRLNGQLWGETLSAAGQNVGVRLGKTRDTFSGTDALGMAVNPDAVTWAQAGELPPLILGEGQRLANIKFLYTLHQASDLTVTLLYSQNAADRRAQRAANLGTQQNPQWVKASTSRVRQLAQQLLHHQIKLQLIDTTHHTPQQTAELVHTN